MSRYLFFVEIEQAPESGAFVDKDDARDQLKALFDGCAPHYKASVESAYRVILPDEPKVEEREFKIGDFVEVLFDGVKRVGLIKRYYILTTGQMDYEVEFPDGRRYTAKKEELHYVSSTVRETDMFKLIKKICQVTCDYCGGSGCAGCNWTGERAPY